MFCLEWEQRMLLGHPGHRHMGGQHNGLTRVGASLFHKPNMLYNLFSDWQENSGKGAADLDICVFPEISGKCPEFSECLKAA